MKRCPFVFVTDERSSQIQQHLEQLLNRTSSSSDLAFLRILQLVRHQTSMLVEDLKTYELPTFVPRSPADSDINKTFNLPIPAAGHSPAISTSITTLLETALEELFVPYTEGQRYIEKECKSLGDLYAGYLANFSRYHVCSICSSLVRLNLTSFRRNVRKKRNHRC